jgi:ferritin-like metal-binding protein YciE
MSPATVSDKTVLDAALIAAAQAVEHYEITRYGSLIAWARQLGRGNGVVSCRQCQTSRSTNCLQNNA